MRKIILFYNTMWDLPLDYPPDAIPAPYFLTADRRMADEAVAIVFHLPTLPPSLIESQLTKKKGQLWIAWCLECDLHFPQMQKPSFMNRFDVTMTYRHDSDVVLAYLKSNLPELLRRPPAEKEDGKLLSAFISSGWNQSKRIEFLLQLMPHIDVHSYGSVFRNRRLANDFGRKTKLKTIGAYRFTLAFENAIANDYVTEKFYDPLIAGSVPVYLGAPNIEDFAPGDRCFINTADWKSPAALAQYLVEVASDEGLYASYFEWKARPFREQFTRLVQSTKVHPFVRLCKKVDEHLRQQHDGSSMHSSFASWLAQRFRGHR